MAAEESMSTTLAEVHQGVDLIGPVEETVHVAHRRNLFYCGE